MEQNLQKKGLVNALLLLLLGVGGAFVARYANSATGIVSAAYLGIGVLVAALSYFQMRLEERERLEKLELDELKKSAAGSATLFAGSAADTFPARRAREQFERYFVPGFTLFLFLVEAAAVWLLWKYVRDDQPSNAQQATVAMALNGLSALIFFQFGKYSAELARLERQRLLRPGASFLLLGAVLGLVTALVEVAGWAGYPQVDLIVARVLAALLGLVAVENLLTLVFEIYRPRLKGQAEHPLYESRLIGLLSQPGGLITTAAQALDYQFGFKVSETWFYRFLEKALAWLVLLQLAVLLLSTTVVFLGPGEEALLERFGHPVAGREVLGSGPHLKWPWPIDKTYRYQTAQIHTFKVGLVQDPLLEQQRVLVWTRTHAKEEFNMLVASTSTNDEQTVPVNLLAVDIPVQYQINNLRDFAYNHANADELLERLANGEVTRYFVSVDLNDIMTTGRQAAAEALRERIQQRADAYRLGVNILFVGLHSVHPPVKVAPAFEEVIGAMQDRDATNLYAHAEAAEILPLAHAEAAEKTNLAAVYGLRETTAASAEAARFTNQLAAYRASPDVYRVRTYLDTLGRSIAGARKYIVVPTNAHEVVILDLEDRIRPDLLNELSLPATKTK
ncbi:MAG: protease modulator HflK [Verrucomicrobiota bacterium]|jgi:HflK protein